MGKHPTFVLPGAGNSQFEVLSPESDRQNTQNRHENATCIGHAKSLQYNSGKVYKLSEEEKNETPTEQQARPTNMQRGLPKGYETGLAADVEGVQRMDGWLRDMPAPRDYKAAEGESLLHAVSCAQDEPLIVLSDWIESAPGVLTPVTTELDAIFPAPSGYFSAYYKSLSPPRTCVAKYFILLPPLGTDSAGSRSVRVYRIDNSLDLARFFGDLRSWNCASRFDPLVGDIQGSDRRLFSSPISKLNNQHADLGTMRWFGWIKLQHQNKKDRIEKWAAQNETDHTPGNDWRVIWRIAKDAAGRDDAAVARIESVEPGAF